MNTEIRWQLALHESAHAVAALVLGGRALGVCLLDGDGGGLCQSDELNPTAEAFMVAAGPEAETLSKTYPVPDIAVQLESASIANIETLPIFASSPALACRMLRTPDTRPQNDSDARHLALWAIFLHEDDPESWVRRIALARNVAQELVERNAEKIVAVAKKLFQRSSLSESEIKTIVEGCKS
jgi:hypothetical protein